MGTWILCNDVYGNSGYYQSIYRKGNLHLMDWRPSLLTKKQRLNQLVDESVALIIYINNSFKRPTRNWA